MSPASPMKPRPTPDLDLTRWVAAFLVPFLITAAAMLYLFPNDTARLFAWPITPALTALLMGAGYASGIYFFTRVALARRWSAVAAGFLPVAVFAWLMLIGTLLHWDRFTRDHISFFAWTGLYILTPFLVPALWLINQRRRPAESEPEGLLLPYIAAALLALAGLLQIATGLFLFLSPQSLIPIWPWAITPLTARALASFFVLAGLTDLAIGVTRTWSRVKIVLETQLIGLTLILLALPRALADFVSPAHLAFTAVSFSAIFAFTLLTYLYMLRLARTAPTPAPRPEAMQESSERAV